MNNKMPSTWRKILESEQYDFGVTATDPTDFPEGEYRYYFYFLGFMVPCASREVPAKEGYATVVIKTSVMPEGLLDEMERRTHKRLDPAEADVLITRAYHDELIPVLNR